MDEMIKNNGAPAPDDEDVIDNSKTRISGIVSTEVDEQTPGDDSTDMPAEKTKKKSKKKKKSGSRVFGKTSLPANIITAFAYIAFVLVVATVLSYLAIVYANDVFAFKKSGDEVTVTLGEYPDIYAVRDLLAESGAINYPDVFMLFAKLKKYNNLTFEPGTYTVSPSMSYEKLVYTFVKQAPQRQSITVTVPEGYCVDDLIDLMLSKGIGTREGWVNAINNTKYDYWFLKDMTVPENRIYKLEGYLYPDTYYFWSNSKETVAVDKMLANFAEKFKKKYMARCEEIGMSLDQVITLASVIEKEAKFDIEYPTVSSVFHNRLDSNNMRALQSDATVQYAIRHFEGKRKDTLTASDIQFESYYNTYLHEGLTPGPICNPSIDSISAAMYPAETNYLFFVADVDGYSLFAATVTEHEKNVAVVKANIDAARRQKGGA